jgi:dihydroxy-acid dehydratase
MGSASPPANDPRKDEVCVEAGRLVMDLLHRGLTPADILTRESFENAIAAGAATGARPTSCCTCSPSPRGGIPLDIDDFDRVANPIIATSSPAALHGVDLRARAARPSASALDGGL